MEDIIKNLVEKISSYDILNNLFPGVIFCSIVERTTRITFSTGEIWELQEAIRFFLSPVC